MNLNLIPVTKNEELINENCSICLGDYQNVAENVLRTKCNHIFHAACVNQWAASNPTCPNCRSSLLRPWHDTLITSLKNAPKQLQDGAMFIKDVIERRGMAALDLGLQAGFSSALVGLYLGTTGKIQSNSIISKDLLGVALVSQFVTYAALDKIKKSASNLFNRPRNEYLNAFSQIGSVVGGLTGAVMAVKALDNSERSFFVKFAATIPVAGIAGFAAGSVSALVSSLAWDAGAVVAKEFAEDLQHSASANSRSEEGSLSIIMSQ